MDHQSTKIFKVLSDQNRIGIPAMPSYKPPDGSVPGFLKRLLGDDTEFQSKAVLLSLLTFKQKGEIFYRLFRHLVKHLIPK